MTQETGETLLSVQEAAQRLGRTAPALYKAIRHKHLPAHTLLGRLGIRLADLEEYRCRTQTVGKKGGRPRHPPHI